MAEFLKSLSNTIVIAVTVLSIVGILFGTLNIYTGLGILALLLFIGFISLIIYYLFKLEKKIDEIEKKFKRADELVDMKGDIKALKIMILKGK